MPLAEIEGISMDSAANFKPDNFMCMSTPLDWILPCLSYFVMPEKQKLVQLFFGKYHGTITEPGCYFRTTIGMERRQADTGLITFDMTNVEVLDACGNFVIISEIVTYFIEDSRKAAIDVWNPHRFVRDQAPVVLKRVVSHIAYACIRKQGVFVTDYLDN